MKKWMLAVSLVSASLLTNIGYAEEMPSTQANRRSTITTFSDGNPHRGKSLCGSHQSIQQSENY